MLSEYLNYFNLNRLLADLDIHQRRSQHGKFSQMVCKSGQLGKVMYKRLWDQDIDE